MGVAEGVKAFVEPTIKLLETVSRGVGTLYEPRKIRKLAEARTYEINVISEAVRSNMDIPIVYNPENGVVIDASKFQEMSERAGKRFLFHEITKQQNIDSVVDKAYLELEGDESVSSDPVGQDWILRFFNSVGEVSNKQMQALWAKVLSGEVRKPGSFSLRTLLLLNTLSELEAEALKRIAPFSITHSNASFLYGDVDIIHKYGFGRDMIVLCDCGLIAESMTTALIGTIDKKTSFITAANIALICHNSEPEKYSVNVQRFTPAGRELLKLFTFEQNREYVIECFRKIKKQHPKLSMTAHDIINIINNNVVYEQDYDLLTQLDK